MPARSLAAAAEDPIALYAPRLFRAFGWYLRWFFWRNFHAVRIARDGCLPVTTDRPLIIYANHPSWWDPALFMLLASTIVHDRRGFGPMEAEALGRYKLFRRLGVYGIDTATRQGAARFMDTSLRILAQPGTALWITSEGRFTDGRVRPTRLRPGLAHLARRVPDAVIVPLAIEYTFWNERKPEALLRFGSPIEAEAGRSRDIAAWNALLEQRLTETMDGLANSAISRDPSRFQRLLSGRAGVGGVYDVGRRLAALAHFRHAQLAHEPGRETRR
ncbi:lysophospholipid acyltransferase family protein [Rhodopila sp.]|uniref:lysophospholipid acyltransferase family protein n=1 Tax=Rhodopila sp. TaxID=2480087 RepID=UPI003D129FBC